MEPQDLTIEDFLADAQTVGASPVETAGALRKWRDDMAAFGRNKDPETYWTGSMRLDQDLAPVLNSLREQEGTRILRESVPMEQRGMFSQQYTEAGGNPEQMNPAFKDVATKLNALSADPAFELPIKPSILTLSTDDGKPLADAIVRGGEALVRPLKEGSKPFLVPVKQYTREELDGLAAEVGASIASKQASSKLLTDMMPYTGKEFNQEVQTKLARELADEQVKAQIYKTGDPAALATLEIGETIKNDENLLAQVADKSLADRFQAGMLRASINTTRALGDMSDFLGGKESNDIFAGFEEALTTTNADTARSFRPTTGDKILSSTAESMGQMAPTLAGFGAARAGGVLASEGAVAASMAPASYGGELAQMLASAKEAEDAGDLAKARQLRSVARWSSLAQAAIDTGTEMMFGDTAAMLGGGKGALKRLATGTVEGGVEEVAAGVLERGVKEPAFYPEDMQAKSLGEGAATEFASGALATGAMRAPVEGPRAVMEAARGLAGKAAPDPGTAEVVNQIFDAAADLASLDLPEESPQGVADVMAPAQADALTPPAPAQPGEDLFSSITDPEIEAPPSAPEISEDGSAPPTEEGGTPPETVDPAVVEQAPGGVSDLSASTEEPAMGSSTPDVSNEQVPSVPENVNPLVDMGFIRELAAAPTESTLRQELNAYSPEERAVIAQELGLQDSSPAALTKALRYQEDGPARYSIGDVPMNRMTEAQARQALGTAARGVTFINDPEARTPWGAPWAGKADRSTGEVAINLAHISSTEDLVSRVKEEKLHIVWQDPAVRSAVSTLEAALTPSMLAEVERLGYEPGMLTEEAAARMVERITRTPDGRSAWRRFMDAVRNAFRRLFRMEPDARQVEAAAHDLLRYAMSEKAQSAAPRGSQFSAVDNRVTQRMNVLRAILDCLTAA